MDEGYKGIVLAHKYTQYMDYLLADIFHSVDRNAPFCAVGNRWLWARRACPFF